MRTNSGDFNCSSLGTFFSAPGAATFPFSSVLDLHCSATCTCTILSRLGPGCHSVSIPSSSGCCLARSKPPCGGRLPNTRSLHGAHHRAPGHGCPTRSTRWQSPGVLATRASTLSSTFGEGLELQQHGKRHEHLNWLIHFSFPRTRAALTPRLVPQLRPIFHRMATRARRVLCAQAACTRTCMSAAQQPDGKQRRSTEINVRLTWVCASCDHAHHNAHLIALATHVHARTAPTLMIFCFDRSISPFSSPRSFDSFCISNIYVCILLLFDSVHLNLAGYRHVNDEPRPKFHHQ